MAFIKKDDELEPGQLGEVPAPIPGASTISGQGDTTQGTKAGAPTERAGTSPAPFVGLQDYLKANAGKSSQLGTQVAGQVGQQSQEAVKAVGEVGGKLDTAIEAGKGIDTGTAGQKAKDITAAGASGQGTTADQENEFRKISTAAYKGPNTQEDLKATDVYKDAVDKTRQAQDYSKLAKQGEAGNQQLLKDAVKTPTYNQGQARLDSYLLETNENRGKISGAVQDTAGLSGQLDQQVQESGDNAVKAKADVDKVRQDSQKQLEDQRVVRSKQVQDRLQGELTHWQDQYNSYLDKLNSSKDTSLTISPEEMKSFGLEPGDHLFNLLNEGDNTRFLKQEQFDANKVVSKDEQAQLSALDRLAGQYGGTQTNQFTSKELAQTLSRETALNAKALGASAKTTKIAFDAAAKIVAMTASVASSQGLNRDQTYLVGRDVTRQVVSYVTQQIPRQVMVETPRQVTNYVTSRVGGYLGQMVNKTVAQVTTIIDRVLTTVYDSVVSPVYTNTVDRVYDTATQNVEVGRSGSTDSVTGTVDNYLSGGGTTGWSGSQTTATNARAIPDDGQTSTALASLAQQLSTANTAQAKIDWATKIQEYLKEQGYGNVVK